MRRGLNCGQQKQHRRRSHIIQSSCKMYILATLSTDAVRAFFIHLTMQCDMLMCVIKHTIKCVLFFSKKAKQSKASEKNSWKWNESTKCRIHLFCVGFSLFCFVTASTFLVLHNWGDPMKIRSSRCVINRSKQKTKFFCALKSIYDELMGYGYWFPMVNDIHLTRLYFTHHWLFIGTCAQAAHMLYALIHSFIHFDSLVNCWRVVNKS